MNPDHDFNRPGDDTSTRQIQEALDRMAMHDRSAVEPGFIEEVISRSSHSLPGRMRLAATTTIHQAIRGSSWGRLALAACILAAIIVASPWLGSGDARQVGQLGFASAIGVDSNVLDNSTVVEPVLVALIDDRAATEWAELDTLRGSSEVGDALAPMLQMRQTNFDDLQTEMDLILATNG
ncbi:MAG: hypothetical protein CMJ32_11795 [Phycisphaerae bacterium]|nr:hypothetical protein [Phycisphaerae bacterium]